MLIGFVWFVVIRCLLILLFLLSHHQLALNPKLLVSRHLFGCDFITMRERKKKITTTISNNNNTFKQQQQKQQQL